MLRILRIFLVHFLSFCYYYLFLFYIFLTQQNNCMIFCFNINCSNKKITAGCHNIHTHIYLYIGPPGTQAPNSCGSMDALLKIHTFMYNSVFYVILSMRILPTSHFVVFPEMLPMSKRGIHFISSLYIAFVYYVYTNM